jgi:hypothetical protein
MSFTVLDTGDIRADFGEGIEPFTFNPATMPETLFPTAVAKGVIANLSGATAKLTGDDRNGANLRKAVVGRWDLLKSGIWGAPRGEGAGEEVSMEAEAAHVFRIKRGEKKGQPYTGTLDQSAADFAALSDEQTAKLKDTPLYKLAYAEVKAARSAAKLAKLQKKAAEAGDDGDF